MSRLSLESLSQNMKITNRQEWLPSALKRHTLNDGNAEATGLATTGG
jgi:hypothetical protein